MTLAMFRARQGSSSSVRFLLGLEAPPHDCAALRAAILVRLWQGLRTKAHFTCPEGKDAARVAPGDLGAANVAGRDARTVVVALVPSGATIVE